MLRASQLYGKGAPPPQNRFVKCEEPDADERPAKIARTVPAAADKKDVVEEVEAGIRRVDAEVNKLTAEIEGEHGEAKIGDESSFAQIEAVDALVDSAEKAITEAARLIETRKKLCSAGGEKTRPALERLTQLEESFENRQQEAQQKFKWVRMTLDKPRCNFCLGDAKVLGPKLEEAFKKTEDAEAPFQRESGIDNLSADVMDNGIEASEKAAAEVRKAVKETEKFLTSAKASLKRYSSGDASKPVSDAIDELSKTLEEFSTKLSEFSGKISTWKTASWTRSAKEQLQAAEEAVEKMLAEEEVFLRGLEIEALSVDEAAATVAKCETVTADAKWAIDRARANGAKSVMIGGVAKKEAEATIAEHRKKFEDLMKKVNSFTKDTLQRKKMVSLRQNAEQLERAEAAAKRAVEAITPLIKEKKISDLDDMVSRCKRYTTMEKDALNRCTELKKALAQRKTESQGNTERLAEVQKMSSRLVSVQAPLAQTRQKMEEILAPELLREHEAESKRLEVAMTAAETKAKIFKPGGGADKIDEPLSALEELEKAVKEIDEVGEDVVKYYTYVIEIIDATSTGDDWSGPLGQAKKTFNKSQQRAVTIERSANGLVKNAQSVIAASARTKVKGVREVIVRGREISVKALLGEITGKATDRITFDEFTAYLGSLPGMTLTAEQKKMMCNELAGGYDVIFVQQFMNFMSVPLTAQFAARTLERADNDMLLALRNDLRDFGKIHEVEVEVDPYTDQVRVSGCSTPKMAATCRGEMQECLSYYGLKDARWST